MNIIASNSAPTMTSREIAGLTDKRHDNVMADIKKMLFELSEDALKFQAIYLDSMNREQTEFRLDRELTETLLTGYSAVLRRKVIARWRELESAAPAFQVPTTLSGALRLAAEQAETIEAQALLIEAAKPAVEFVENYVSSTSGSKGFRETCKLLKANESRFREFLIEEKIMYRLGGALMPHAAHMDAGRFEVKAGTALETGHAYNSAKFTAKGINWIAAKWAVHNLPKE